MSRTDSSLARPRAFIVEDDAAVRDGLALLADGEGWDVLSYENGGHFLHDARPDEKDIVFLDISLPGLDGVEIARAMKIRGDNCRVVVISGLRNAAFANAVSLIKPDLAMRKPIETGPLLAFLGGH